MQIITSTSVMNKSTTNYAVAYLGFYFRGGKGSIYFCKTEGICTAQSAMQRVASHAFVRGVRRHAPPRKKLKMVQFGAFWKIFC